MSQDELVDIVNEKGEVVGITTKKEAHEKGLLHKTAIAEVVDSKGRWLFVKQPIGKQDVGQYVSPAGGHVVSGESDELALRREVEEEIGLSGDYKYEYIGKTIYNRHVIGRHENHYFIVYKIYSDHIPVLNHECESYKYFTEEELKKELRQNPGSFAKPVHFIVKNFFTEFL